MLELTDLMQQHDYDALIKKKQHVKMGGSGTKVQICFTSILP
jgi:hypothetical protein